MPAVEATAGTRSPRGTRARHATGDERERAILETAESLLGERSLHEISVDDLASGAGISRPTFYFYFSSKEAVLLALLDRVVEEARAARDSALDRPDDDQLERLRQGIRGTFETFRAHRAVMMAGADVRATSPAVREVWAEVMEGFVSVAAEVIDAERAAGSAPPGPPARRLAIALNLMNERVLHSTFAGHEPAIGEDDVVEALAAVWFGAIYGKPFPPGE
jgi:TetR/AcrR family transcriptional regulator, ethionamide resistance regulator